MIIYRLLEKSDCNNRELEYQLAARLQWRDYSLEAFKQEFLDGHFNHDTLDCCEPTLSWPQLRS